MATKKKQGPKKATTIKYRPLSKTTVSDRAAGIKKAVARGSTPREAAKNWDRGVLKGEKWLRSRAGGGNFSKTVPVKKKKPASKKKRKSA